MLMGKCVCALRKRRWIAHYALSELGRHLRIKIDNVSVYDANMAVRKLAMRDSAMCACYVRACRSNRS